MNKTLKKQIANKGYTDEQVSVMVDLYDTSVKQAEEQLAKQKEEADLQEEQDNGSEGEQEVIDTATPSAVSPLKEYKEELQKMVRDMVKNAIKGTPNPVPKPNITKIHPDNGIDPWGDI